ncbi:hypothetical protein [Nocardia brasiliensis]|uniref:hypothetical protein n=1 Tax=Nocardia brasiliensis TaxID=37326 RepID=UPI002457B865|nr:hypothetical protein [Nocardia brasiliensis]
MGKLWLKSREGRLVRADLIAEFGVSKIAKADSRLPDEFAVEAQMTYLSGSRYGDVDLGPTTHSFGRYGSEDLAAAKMRHLVELIATYPAEQAAVIWLPDSSGIVVEQVDRTDAEHG